MESKTEVMKKLISVIYCLLISYISFAQPLTEYKASNGITYHIGDTIKLGMGSAPNGNFRYLQMGGMFNTLAASNVDNNSIASWVGKNYAGLNVILKKIKQNKLKGATSTYFVVGGGNITNYNLYIEEALKTGEVKSAGYTSDEALSELKKAKDKLDLGLINQAQYDSTKRVLQRFIK